MWIVKCDKNDAPRTIYDKKHKADRVATLHNRNNYGHNAYVYRVSVSFTIIEEKEK